MTTRHTVQLSFVTCASNLAVLGQRLLASPCLQPGGLPLAVHFNAASAAAGFNASLVAANSQVDPGGVSRWLVWVHQDVFLPAGWDERFAQAITQAMVRWPRLAVAGIYGIAGAAARAQRAGHVLDRGVLLREPAELPCQVDSLDELLFAVRVNSGLQLDAALGFDFYATDLVLQTQAQGWQCVVVDALCEHWSGTAASGAVPAAVVARIAASAAVFERKWVHQLPITTPCFEIAQPGDVAAFMASIVTPEAAP